MCLEIQAEMMSLRKYCFRDVSRDSSRTNEFEEALRSLAVADLHRACVDIGEPLQRYTNLHKQRDRHVPGCCEYCE